MSGMALVPEPAAGTEQVLSILIRLLYGRRFDYVDEKVCQVQIENLLKEKQLTFIREHDFGGRVGICDFFFPRSGIVLEAKAFKSCSKREVYRQCERYCGHPDVKGLLLATGKAQGLPATICGKPTRVYQLGLGAL